MLKLSCLAASGLLARCAKAPVTVPDDLTDGRLHARADLFEDKTMPPTPKPQPLGLGSERDGYFYVPATVKEPMPLLLFLHGASGAGVRVIERLVEHADRTGTIVLAPDSRDQTWGFSEDDAKPDLAFVDDALESIFTSYRVDPRRIGIAGFSDGASVALSWGLSNGELFSGIAAFSPGFMYLVAPPSGRPRVFISHGTRDSILPIDRCGRRIAGELRAAGYKVDYREFDGEHTVPPEIARAGLESLL